MSEHNLSCVKSDLLNISTTMQMTRFDFNITNYNINDLCEIFKLNPNNFQIIDIETQQEWLKQQIQKDPKMNMDYKQQFLVFITDATDQLLRHHTTINVAGDVKTPNYVQSFPSEIYSGTLNPLKRRTINKVLNIDTRFRLQQDISPSTNFRIELPMQFNNVVNMSLKSFEFPDTYYNISSDLGNNTFTINESHIIIEDGIYTTTSLITYMNTNILGFQFQTLNNKMVINANANTSFSMIFASDPKTLYQTFGWIIGFRKCDYSNATQYTSEAMIDLNTLKYCFLCIDDFNNNVNNSFVSSFRYSILNSNILGRISFPSASPQIIVENKREYFGPVNIQALHVQLLDAFGNIMNLHDLNFSFCLEFEIIYNI